MVDLQPTENFVVDPPLTESDMPLMGNPVLMRGSTPRRGAGNANIGWYVGIPLAVVAVCGGAYFALAGHQSSSLMTNAGPAAPPAQVATAEPPAPVAPPIATPAPVPAQMAEAAPEPAMTPVQLAPRHLAHRTARAAPAATDGVPSASDSGIDASAAAPMTPPPAAPVQAAPVQAAPEAAPAPVITPPPPAQ